jgi:hypothetical protein
MNIPPDTTSYWALTERPASLRRNAVYPQRRRLSHRVQVFIEWVGVLLHPAAS